MKSIAFNTAKSKKEVYLTLKEITNSEPEHRLFVGDIKEDGFSVMRYQPFSNNVLNPQINATVIENKNGAEINMKASLNKYDIIGFSIMGIMLFGIFVFLVINAMVSGVLGKIFPAVAVLFFIVLVFIFLSCVFALKTKRIVKMLKAKLI